jgi:hypothetical protein
MENGPARAAGVARHLQLAGDRVADMFEVALNQMFPLFLRKHSKIIPFRSN